MKVRMFSGVPPVDGRARMTGINTIFIDDHDRFAHGFVVT